MPPTPAPPPVPANKLADKNYRVRRLFVKIDLDVYDDEGFLLDRGETEPIVIPEAQFSAGLVDWLRANTDLAKGFVDRVKAAPLHAVPAPPDAG